MSYKEVPDSKREDEAPPTSFRDYALKSASTWIASVC